MADRNITNKLNQFENSIKAYIDQNFDLFKSYLDDKIKTKLSTPQENEFSINYFQETENSDADYILANDEDAVTLINGILNHKLQDTPDSAFCRNLKKFDTFVLCR